MMSSAQLLPRQTTNCAIYPCFQAYPNMHFASLQQKRHMGMCLYFFSANNPLLIG